MSIPEVVPNMSIIVAVARNNAIGLNNDLLWHIPDDLKRFKSITSGHKIIMGRNTYFSLPRRPLPNRVNVVLTDDKEDKILGCEMAYSIEDVIKHCEGEKECFIIGGGMVYKTFLPLAGRLYLTKVDEDFEADVFFPEIDETEWKLISREDLMHKDESKSFPYSYLVYTRK